MKNKQYNCLHSAARNYDDYCPTCIQEKKEADELERYKNYVMVSELKSKFSCEHGLASDRCSCFASYMYKKLSDAKNGGTK